MKNPLLALLVFLFAPMLPSMLACESSATSSLTCGAPLQCASCESTAHPRKESPATTVASPKPAPAKRPQPTRSRYLFM